MRGIKIPLKKGGEGGCKLVLVKTGIARKNTTPSSSPFLMGVNLMLRNFKE